MTAPYDAPGPELSVIVPTVNERDNLHELVRRLHDCLRKVGLNVWLDKQGGLTEGDAYRTKIRQDIARCTLFLPLLSRNTERRKEGFFREEWYEAIQRLPRFKGSSRPFIMPIVIDDLPIYEAADIPEEFKQLHMTRAPGGDLPEDVTTRYQQIVRGIIKAEGGLQ